MAPALWSAVDGVCAALRSDATFCADIHDTKADTSMVSAQAVSLTPVSVLRPPHKTGLLLPDSTTELSATALVDSAVRTSHADTTAVDTAAVSHISDSLPRRPRRVVRRKVDLDNAVAFASKDSMVMIRRDSAIMYGESTVSYGDFKLNAAEIDMDLRDNTVYAVSTTDTAGEEIGKPVFTEGGTDYAAHNMRYNFKTRKGILYDVLTQQGEGFLQGGVTKKDSAGVYYFQNGKYTTCDDHDCPHFYFQITKGKMHPGKNVVTGPTYLVLAGLPLPVAVPFGYFPFTETYSSGVIFPTFGDDYNRGFYLCDGGYYFAINQNSR